LWIIEENTNLKMEGIYIVKYLIPANESFPHCNSWKCDGCETCMCFEYQGQGRTLEKFFSNRSDAIAFADAKYAANKESFPSIDFISIDDMNSKSGTLKRTMIYDSPSFV